MSAGSETLLDDPPTSPPAKKQRSYSDGTAHRFDVSPVQLPDPVNTPSEDFQLENVKRFNINKEAGGIPLIHMHE